MVTLTSWSWHWLSPTSGVSVAPHDLQIASWSLGEVTLYLHTRQHMTLSLQVSSSPRRLRVFVCVEFCVCWNVSEVWQCFMMLWNWLGCLLFVYKTCIYVVCRRLLQIHHSKISSNTACMSGCAGVIVANEACINIPCVGTVTAGDTIEAAAPSLSIRSVIASRSQAWSLNISLCSRRQQDIG